MDQCIRQDRQKVLKWNVISWRMKISRITDDIRRELCVANAKEKELHRESVFRIFQKDKIS